MTVAVVSSGMYSMGHAVVGHRLASYLRFSKVPVTLFSDQSDILAGSGTCLDALPLTRIEEFCLRHQSRDNILFFDSIPLRRSDLLFSLVKASRATRATRVTGHTGWLPKINDSLVGCWRELLDFVGIKTIVVYHGTDVCNGKCHISNLAKTLGVRVVHSGLLFPLLSGTKERRSRSLVLSMGGGAVAEPIVQLANRIAHSGRWEVTLFVGPYAAFRGSLCEKIRWHRFGPQFLDHLRTAEASIARSGYGTCVDHIATKTPVLFMPMKNEDNPEQKCNASWASRFTHKRVVVRGSNVRILPSANVTLPVGFNWSSVWCQL